MSQDLKKEQNDELFRLRKEVEKTWVQIMAVDVTLDRMLNKHTKREKYAAMAMQALLSNPDVTLESFDEYARDAVKAADALINKLTEKETK